jgi:1,4-dihydroxy-2-naphthoate octaprenyltransferase
MAKQMTNRTITSLSLLGTGLALLIVGAVLGNDTLLTVGTTVMATAVAYAAGKFIASQSETK